MQPKRHLNRRLRRVGALVIPLAILLSQSVAAVPAVAQTDPTPSPSETVTPTAEPTPLSETATSTAEPTSSETGTPTDEPSPTSSATIPPDPPTLSSDSPNHPAGALVTLTGTNWVAGETVHIRVNDDQGQVWLREVDVIANDSGVITDSFNLPEQFVAVYRAVASTPDGRTASTTFTDAPKPDLDQCQNGSLASPAASACSAANANDWARGNLTESKAHYFEGADSIPQRLVASGADAGTQYSVTIDYDTTKSAKHAFDYLTTYDRTVATAYHAPASPDAPGAREPQRSPTMTRAFHSPTPPAFSRSGTRPSTPSPSRESLADPMQGTAPHLSRSPLPSRARPARRTSPPMGSAHRNEGRLGRE